MHTDKHKKINSHFTSFVRISWLHLNGYKGNPNGSDTLSISTVNSANEMKSSNFSGLTLIYESSVNVAHANLLNLIHKRDKIHLKHCEE